MINFLPQLPILQTAAPAGGGGQMLSLVVTFGVIIAIFYFLVIRPQGKKRKESEKMLETLKKGDKISTIGGMRGTITAVKEQTVTVKVDDNTKVEFSKSAISNVLEKKESSVEAKE